MVLPDTDALKRKQSQALFRFGVLCAIAIIASLTWPMEKTEKSNDCSTMMSSLKPQTSVPDPPEAVPASATTTTIDLEAEFQELHRLVGVNVEYVNQFALTGNTEYLNLRRELEKILKLDMGKDELQQLVNLYEWRSLFPPNQYNVSQRFMFGQPPVPLFQDGRVAWVNAMMENGFNGKTVLEYGPLEGAHLYMAATYGAKSILGVEGHGQSFLKCLITKKIFGLDQVTVIHDDLNAVSEALIAKGQKFDFIMGAGVLYHMIEPWKTLHNMARLGNSMHIWTQYFHPEVKTIQRFVQNVTMEYDGFTFVGAAQDYGEYRGASTFYGGAEQHSVWLTLETIVGYLQTKGFTVHMNEALSSKDHPNGPAVTLFATL